MMNSPRIFRHFSISFHAPSPQEAESWILTISFFQGCMMWGLIWLQSASRTMDTLLGDISALCCLLYNSLSDCLVWGLAKVTIVLISREIWKCKVLMILRCIVGLELWPCYPPGQLVDTYSVLIFDIFHLHFWLCFLPRQHVFRIVILLDHVTLPGNMSLESLCCLTMLPSQATCL